MIYKEADQFTLASRETKKETDYIVDNLLICSGVGFGSGTLGKC